MNFLILHGAHGRPDTNWFPWLRERLAGLGHEVRVPNFPTPDGQHLDAWKRVISDRIPWPPATTVLVGHSLGAAFALRLAESAPGPYAAAFLAAGFIGPLGLPSYDSINQSFFADAFDWPRTKGNLGHVRNYASDNDPYVPLERSESIARALGCTTTLIPGAGHLNQETGFLRFEQLGHDLDLFLSGRETR